MAKIDLKKELKHLYSVSAKKVTEVDIPALNYLMIDGKGDPNTSARFQEAVEALFPLAFGIKMASKKTLGIDYVVMPLEGLWWAEDMTNFSVEDKSQWQWRLLILQPEHITLEMVEAARTTVAAKKNPAALPDIRFEAYTEGPSAQILHIGPFADEGPTIARLHEEIEAAGHQRQGLHHEIYLSDLRRTAPEKLRTIIRQPYK